MKNLYRLEVIEDTCGSIAELYRTENMSLAYAWINGQAQPHKHREMKETYIITKRYGHLNIEGKIMKVKKGDILEIPKNKVHFLEKKWHITRNPLNKPLELIVANTPAYNRNDVILG